MIRIDHDEQLISVPITMSKEEVLADPEHRRLYYEEKYTIQFNMQFDEST